MRGTIACIAAVCLALTSGALGAEESQNRLKTFSYDGEVIYSFIRPFWNDGVVYAVCEGAEAEKKCKVYLETTDLANSTVQSCDFKLTYTGRFDHSVILNNVGHSKAVFVVKGSEPKTKLVNVNLKGCTVHEATYEITFDERNDYLYWTTVVPHPDGTKYDLLFSNKQLCGDLYCKATYDYEGKVIKAAAPFPIRYLSCRERCFATAAYANGAYIVAQIYKSLTEVHYVKEDGGQLKNTTLFSGEKQESRFFGLSTEENKFGFCMENDRKISCQQYDVEGKTKLVDIGLNATTYILSVSYADVLNLEKGLLALWYLARRDEKYPINVAHVDEQGKQGKGVVVDANCFKEISLTKLYKSVSGEYCINSICMPVLKSPNRSNFKLITRCFHQDELF